MSAQSPLPAAASAADPSEHEPFISLRLSLAGSPWRLSGGWLMVAGLLATAGPEARFGPLLPLLLALFLTEVVWGALWWQLVPAHAWAANRARRRPALPYVQPASPAGWLLGWPEPGPAAAMARTGLPLAGLAVLLALPLGRFAVALSGVALCAVLLAMIARVARLNGLVSGLQALVQTTLPFALGVSLAASQPAAAHSYLLAGLAMGYTLLAFALAQAAAEGPGHRLLPLLAAGAGLTAVVMALLAAGMLLPAGVVGLLGVGPLLLQARPSDRSARASHAWALAIVLISALAVGFGAG